MLVGDLVASMRLEGADAFNRGVKTAESNFRGLGTTASSMLRGINTVMSATGNVVNLATATVAALGTSAITAGAGFNNLQQNANVALTTLMGSSDAARAQMAKLNDFANTSPFGRDTLIQAQQQMIGFGIEADNVVPYLGAVQDAVAGIGGSNQDITEIVSIISRIRSGASLGQEDLNQLADRGINAAALIAQATGKTEQEVRNSIFGNPLRGEEALAGLDAMMSGMQARFDGAAAGLKENLDGARDRVKAAMRDIGAVISAPVIDPTGGGWGVDLTNSYADILRGVQTAITPMVDELALRLAPAVDDVNIEMQGLASSIRQIDMSDLRAMAADLAPYLPTIAGGLAAISTQGLAAVPVIGGLVSGLNPFAVGLAAAAAASPELREGLGDILEAASPLVPVIGDVATIAAGALASGLGLAGDVLSAVAPLVEMLAEGIAAVPTPMLTAAAAIGAGALAMRAFNDVTKVKTFTDLAGVMPNVTRGVAGVRDTMAAAATAMSDAHRNGAGPLSTTLAGMTPIASGAAGAVGKVGTAIKTAFLTNPVGIIIAGVSTAISAIAIASADADAKTAQWKSQMETLRGTLDQTTAAITEQTEAQIVQDLQASQWGERVEQLAGGTANLSQMTQSITGENYALRDSLVAMEVEGFNWEQRLGGGTQSQYTFADAVKQSGVSMSDWMLAAAGNADATEAVTAGLEKYGYSAAEATNMINDLRTSTGEWNNESMNMEALAYMEEEAAKLQTARDVLEQYIVSMRDLREEGGEAAVQQKLLADAIDGASDASADASERIRDLREALDILNGGAMTAAEQQQQLDDAIRDMGDAFDQAKDDAGNFNSALIDAQGNIDTSTEQGSAFRDSLMAVSDEMSLAAIAAANHAAAVGEDPYSAARDAMVPYVDELTALGEEYGLTDEQIQGMLESLYMMPDEAALALNVTGLDAAEQGLGNIAMQLLGLEEGEHQMFVQADTDEAREAIEELGISVTETSDGRWRIDLSADPVEAQEQIDALVAYVTDQEPIATVGADTAPAAEEVAAWQAAADATVAISTADADAAEARGEVLAWKLEADGTWSVSHMDAESAAADSTVITWERLADGTYAVSGLGADAANAYSSLNGFVGTANSTWATVNIGANTSSANAAIQRLSGRSVTVSVYPQMMYANGGMLAFADGGLLERARPSIQAFADGGQPRQNVPTGIYPGGRPILKFAEPETGWEAFVSGKRGQEYRNLAILRDAQVRLMRQLGLDRERVRAFADGGSSSYRRDIATAAVSSMPGATVTIAGPLMAVDQLVVDSDERVQQVAQQLYTLAERAGRAQGKVSLQGAVKL